MKARVNGTKVVTGEVRFDYPFVLQRRVIEGTEDEKYTVCILVDKEDVGTIRAISLAIEKAKEDGKKFWGDEIPRELKTPLRDGDIERDELIDYKNKYFFNATTKRKPGVVDKNLIIINDKDEIYSGCYGRVSVNFFPYSVNGNNGIACGLLNIQKLTDGNKISGVSNAEEDFSF